MTTPAIINYLVALFMLCSPLTAIPAFLSLTHKKNKDDRRRIAISLGSAVAVILCITPWIGGPVLAFLGIRIAAFQCAGGIVVFLLSLSMLNAQMSPMRQTEEEEAPGSTAIPIVPLAIPMMAGPGAMSSAIAAANIHPSFSNHLILSICGLVIGALTSLILYFAIQLEKKLGNAGLNVVTRIGGLILAALAIELFAQGIEGLFGFS
jgi:multiple antibiotic resistance protein